MDTLTVEDLAIIEQFVVRMYEKTCLVNNVNQWTRIMKGFHLSRTVSYSHVTKVKRTFFLQVQSN